MYPTSKSSAAATIFETPLVSGLGKRLGVPFTRAQLQEIYVHIPSVTTKKSDRILTVEQSGMGILDISTVVWDCGLLMVDYLVSRRKRAAGGSPCTYTTSSVSNTSLGTCLDLGCGTGVVGLAALYLGADKCVFGDKSITPCLYANIQQLPTDLYDRAEIVEFNWMDDSAPLSLTNVPETAFIRASAASIHWTTILCSDVLYEQSSHDCFIGLIKKLKFEELILAYKRRHDARERQVIESLEKAFDVMLVEPSTFMLKNLEKDDTVGLYLLKISPINDN